MNSLMDRHRETNGYIDWLCYPTWFRLSESISFLFKINAAHLLRMIKGALGGYLTTLVWTTFLESSTMISRCCAALSATTSGPSGSFHWNNLVEDGRRITTTCSDLTALDLSLRIHSSFRVRPSETALSRYPEAKSVRQYSKMVPMLGAVWQLVCLAHDLVFEHIIASGRLSKFTSVIYCFKCTSCPHSQTHGRVVAAV